ncbi:histone-lysine N-methyltransferase SETDB1 [Paragonimus westermani]|uniref:Histone-lysine N-methyltransferase SETDB1 n=1 Tax=Paragonimus westermani TaxID=34504 RepID=A0A5J4P061_9TREM|nr:histone-lysine N-methyltransferase SETDB1 [Paragonimus westermani]
MCQNNQHTMLMDVTDLIYKTFNMNQVFEFVMSYIALKYKTELDDVTDYTLKQHIIEQRLPLALEECGVMSVLHEVLAQLGLKSRLEALEREKEELQANVVDMKTKLDNLVSDMQSLQVNSFGRVVRLFDNRIIDLAKEDEDLEVIETSVSDIPTSVPGQSQKDVWRTLQPSELLIGLSLAVGQSVLCRKGRDTWFPGHVIAVLPQSNVVDKNVTRLSDSNATVYQISLDVAPGAKVEQCSATLASIALANSAFELKQKYPVGARVVSIYRDENGGIGYYSGLIAEPPSERNNHRYLLFFDDGYTQYSPPNEIYRICHQSKENWREATEGSQEFIKRYLAQYPQRPMVRLKPGQMIETELDGDWIQAIVNKVDASLVLIRFSPTHSEWIYRGSTRLEPLYNDLNMNTDQLTRVSNQRLEVEYGNVDASLTDKSASKLRKARKSATGNRTSTVSEHETLVTKPVPERRRTTASLRRSTNGRFEGTELENAGSVLPYLDHLFDQISPKEYTPHKCNSSCLLVRRPPSMDLVSEDPFDYKGLNPLEIPFHAGWLRSPENKCSDVVICTVGHVFIARRWGVIKGHLQFTWLMDSKRYMLVGYPNDFGRQFIVYNAPCGRQLRSMHEVQRFLDRTDSKLTTDLFSFDPDLCINNEFRAENEGFDYGDEYQAELDYIETVEKPKEGYESMPEDPDQDDFQDVLTDKPPIRSQSTSCLPNLEENTWRRRSDRRRAVPDSSRVEAESDNRLDTCSVTSSVSESTATEADDDHTSRCSEWSSTSSSRNPSVPLESTQSKKRFETGLRTNTDKPSSNGTRSSNLRVDSRLRGSCRSVSKPVPDTSVSLSCKDRGTPLMSPEIRRAGQDDEFSAIHSINGRVSINSTSAQVEPMSTSDLSPQPTSDHGQVERNVTSSPLHSQAQCMPIVLLDSSVTDISVTLEPMELPKSDEEVKVEPEDSVKSDEYSCAEANQSELADSKQIVVDFKTDGRRYHSKSGRSSYPPKSHELGGNIPNPNLCLESSMKKDQKPQLCFSNRHEKTEIMDGGSESSPEGELIRVKHTRMVRANFRARSASVPAEFTSLCSVRHIIETTDFGRIPRVELLRLDAPITYTPNSLVDRVQSVHRERGKRPPHQLDMRKTIEVQLARESPADSNSESLASAKALLAKAKQFKYPKPLPPLKLRLRHSTSQNKPVYFISKSRSRMFSSSVSNLRRSRSTTSMNIAVGEEMTWDYGYTVDAVPFKVLYCYCGEPNCRIRLL